MKKIILTIAVAATLVGCGGVSISTTNNEQLGTIPSVYLSYSNQIGEVKERMQKNDIDADKARELSVELNKAVNEAAQKAIDEMRGKEVFFSFANGYADDRFEIEKIVINDLTTDTGALDLKVWVIANQFMEADFNANLKYIAIDDKNEVIAKGEINPFLKQKMLVRRQFPFGTTIKEGQYCHGEGTSLMLYCGNYDFTGFKQIVFIP